MTKFEVGNRYYETALGYVTTQMVEVIKRTASFITIAPVYSGIVDMNSKERRKIHGNCNEYIFIDAGLISNTVEAKDKV